MGQKWDNTTRRIHRRANIILVISALAFATLMGLLAAAPAAVWLVAYIGTYAAVGLAAFEGAHAVVRLGLLARDK